MPNLFNLQASVVLDTTQFATDVQNSKDDVQSIGDVIDSISGKKPSMSGFESSVSAAVQNATTEINKIDTEIADAEGKANSWKDSLADGFVGAVNQIIEQGFEQLVEYGAEAVELAAQSGSDMANAFNAAQYSLSTGQAVFKERLGEALLPMATLVAEIADGLLGISDSDKLLYMLDNLEQYKLDNLKQVQGNLSGLFGLFDKVKETEPESIGDMTSGLESQAQYWQDYSDTLSALKEKGVDENLLASLADGTTESFSQLKALAAANEEQLSTLTDAFTAVEEARNATATGVSDLKIKVDEEFASMTSQIETFVGSMDASAIAAQGIADGLAAAYPSIQAEVDKIAEQLSRLTIPSWLQGANPEEVQLLNDYIDAYNRWNENPTDENDDAFASAQGRLQNSDNGSTLLDYYRQWAESNPFEGLGEGELPQLPVTFVPPEDGESSMQSELDGYELEAEASGLLAAGTEASMQSQLDAMHLTATVLLTPDPSGLASGITAGPKLATGMDYVPHDEYPAVLHEGEAVLTKLEAENWRKGGNKAIADQPVVVNLTVNGVSSSPYEIAGEVRNALELLKWRG